MKKLSTTSLVAVLSVVLSQSSSGQQPAQQFQQGGNNNYSVQVPTQQVQQPQASAMVVSNPNAQLINELNSIMTQQARLGNHPGNNPLLQGLQQLINQHSGSNPNPINVGPVVGITNLGPGLLRVGNSTFVQTGNSTQVTIGNANIQLMSFNSQSDIQIRHVRNGIAKFWDVDDQKFTLLRSTDPNPIQINLGQGVQGYFLQK